LRILIVALQYFPDRPSGSDRLAFDEAVELAARGHDVWLIAYNEVPDRPEYVYYATLKLHILRFTPTTRPSLIGRYQFHQQEVGRLLSKVQPGDFDIVHGHSLLHLHGALDVVNADATVGYSIHSPVSLEARASGLSKSFGERLFLEVKGRVLGDVERRLWKRVDFITAFSMYTRSVMSQIYGEELGERIVHFPGWVDFEMYSSTQMVDRFLLKTQLGFPTDRPVLLTLRGLKPRNGLPTLLEATRVLVKRGLHFHLVIAGTGPLERELKQQADQLGIRSYVSFIGRVEEEILPKLYGSADLFVLPTAMLECFGLIILEAFAAGTPVIATPAGAIPELIHPIEPRWLCSENNADSLAQTIQAFLMEQLPHHSAEELRSFAQKFSHEHALNSLVDYVLAQPALLGRV